MVKAGLDVSVRQIKDARKLLDWSARELSERAGLHERSIQRIEITPETFEKMAIGNVRRIVRVLEDAGIEFLSDGNVRRIQGS